MTEDHAEEELSSAAKQQISDATDARIVRTLGTGASVAVLFVVLRLLVVSEWDWRVASRIMAVTDVNSALTIVLGTLMSDPEFTGALVMVLLPLSALRLAWRMHAKSSTSVWSALLVAVLASACIALTLTYGYYWVPAGAGAIALAILAVRHWFSDGISARTADFAVREVGSIAAVAVLVLAAVERTPWTPTERIHTRSGVVAAHVLKVESGYLTALTESDREVIIINSSEVLRREPI
ncbi:putative protein OS=Tsukamurella paurometabola (strain ATCC 8368 / DSM / CCUG 35730 /CIP 100753 / JCM 10117 / KCTC 9821 / NBRC 16120 / NCIMB 702349/ NCTC 13040) OX=521096 GN=Tpau_2008 PE=4 SV=1 [Tsukamurella paurometabola]|uniref:Uncharacterized protein n=1 Tax=Tsukamurella paurometabola (strain ATCC 8368 / DSM 20162 / CCUG 35730 / CIP 100753 / JCM 10117 / KCTC 9821 / NBRC 16120 / NCIMB 702349 / NCTC 13040) TaxID=521096 RepID=D5UNQ2_TSUPD|nr:hypothetical protein [Tsukamurella paurometabola]ADG78620.1 conserved hypothetical protein [Tsukamurella paurometabola DSM 20162]SUP32453.1 Uncharacterised protein [Tsukamurella paurometabola]